MNIIMLINIIILFVVFFGVNYFAWWFTEGRRFVPDFLAYKPFMCKKCLTFWSHLITYVSIFLILNFNWFILISGLILTVANTIAIIIEERSRWK